MIRPMFSVAILFAGIVGLQDVSAQGRNWESYYGSRGNDHFSELKQVDRTNVGRLREAWRFDTREAGGLETTPLIVDGVVYAVTPSQKVIALDGRTGKLVWTFDAHAGSMAAKRGLTYWQEGRERRIFIGITDRLYCLDPSTGELVKSFGGAGYVDLREHLGREVSAQSIGLSSPGVIYRDLIVVGSQVAETLPAPPGDIRAYDVRTGALRWRFHTIPH
ncbi:MAG TPA: PQQ-binding-like beta-propeller repeat protein, partial [Edaphobacter sp.]|nr:PQQ-binding-like beta-propeller repeat protein [Edaphobacter sp.]